MLVREVSRDAPQKVQSLRTRMTPIETRIQPSARKTPRNARAMLLWEHAREAWRLL